MLWSSGVNPINPTFIGLTPDHNQLKNGRLLLWPFTAGICFKGQNGRYTNQSTMEISNVQMNGYALTISNLCC